MINYTRGDLLKSDAQALVNPVNTVGVMGKGLASAFKHRFADNFRDYAKACKAGQVRTGEMFVTRSMDLLGPEWVVNFPTKQRWQDPSQMAWIVDGLQALRRFIRETDLTSIAIPALGCGNGGLSWPDVRREIEATLGDLRGAKITVFEP